MPSDPGRVAVAFTPEFKRNVRRLARKYRHLRDDLQPILDQIQRGETPGDQIPRLDYTVYKVRIPSRDMKRGKRGGYRLLYYLKTPQQTILVTIYSKSDQGDLSAQKIRRIINAYSGSL